MILYQGPCDRCQTYVDTGSADLYVTVQKDGPPTLVLIHKNAMLCKEMHDRSTG